MRIFSAISCLFLFVGSSAVANGSSSQLAVGDIFIPSRNISLNCHVASCFGSFQQGKYLTTESSIWSLAEVDASRPWCMIQGYTWPKGLVAAGMTLRISELARQGEIIAAHLVSENPEDPNPYAALICSTGSGSHDEKTLIRSILGSHFDLKSPLATAGPNKQQVIEALAKLNAILAQLADNDPRRPAIEGAIAALKQESR